MHDNTELHGDGSAVIKNGANTIGVGQIRSDIQYHHADPDLWDHFKLVRNITINNLRFENSLQSAIWFKGHDGESHITNNQMIGGRITAEDIGYPNHGIMSLIIIATANSLVFGAPDDAIKGVINADNNYIDGQWRLDPNGHKYWYYDRPDLKYNGINWGICNCFTGATFHASGNVIKNVGIGIFQGFNISSTPQVSRFANNTIDVLNGPYESAGIFMTFTVPTNYVIANNEITVDYKPELDFATYPEWGSDPDAEYLHAIFYNGIHMDTPHLMDNETIITNNTIRFTNNHPEEYLFHAGMFFFWEESNMAITHNKFAGSANSAIHFLGGNNHNVMQANKFNHFAHFPEGYVIPAWYFAPWEIYVESADIIFGSIYPADYNTVIGGGSSSGKLDIVDNGTGNIVGNNNVAHSDVHDMKAYLDLLRERKQQMKDGW
jgi:hypothetical protein